ncbi:VWA domain-containing protein [Isosphaeraceae bacterium EP7]
MDWLLRRLADRLGVERARAGEAITPHVRFEQPWSQGVLLLVLAASIALVIWLYRREGQASRPWKVLLASLRICLILLAVFMLSEAVLSVDRTGLPYFVVMLDDSASGQIVDQPADPKAKAAAQELAKAAGKTEPSRAAVAQGLLARDDAAWLKELQKQHKIRLYLLSGAASSLAEVDKPEDVKPALEKVKAATAQGAQSRLGSGVRQVLTELRGVPPTAILLATDGQTTDGETLPQAAEFAARKGVPLFVIGLGDSEPARDLEIGELLVDDVVFADDLVRFQAKLSSKGFAGQPLTVKLKQRDASGAVRDLETISVVAPPDGQPARIEIPHRPKDVGDITYVVQVEPRERELQVENNAIVRTVTVRKDQLKVLLVDGDPRYEYRYLKTYLERDSTIDLSVVLLSSDPEYSEQDRSALPTMPASKEDLFKFDAVIMGDADPSFLSAVQMQNLVEFVAEKGAGLLFVAGENFNPLLYRGTPLEPLFPVELGDARNPIAVGNNLAAYRPELTAEGRTSPIFRFGEDEASSEQIWQSLPPLYWFMETPRKKPAALVLAEHPTATGSDGKLPLMLYQFYGSGKVMFNAVDDTWRWRFRVGDKYFGRYWVQTIRFLARTKLLGQKQAEVTTDRRRYQRNQPVIVRVRFPNPALAPGSGELAVQIERKGQGPRRLTLKNSTGAKNVFEGALPQASEGEYTVRLLPPPILEGAVPTAGFRVDPPAGELERVPMNRAELIRTASTSGGKFYTPEAVDSLLSDLPKPQKVPLDTDPPIPLWNSWPVLALFLTVLTAEWALRKRNQMV